MPSKPDKYGMKLFLLCDCLTGYTFNGMPYIGRQGNQRNVGLSADVVKHLSQPLISLESTLILIIGLPVPNWLLIYFKSKLPRWAR